MATITGTSTADVLYGTPDADILLPYGVGPLEGPDWMSGGAGADVYDLAEPIGEDPVHRYRIDDAGGDGAVDRIINAGKLIHSASLGYIGYVAAERVGDDLVIVTPSKPHRFRDPAKPSFEITIVDHFDGDPVEELVAGGVTYALPSGTVGTGLPEILAGTEGADILDARGGDDFLLGNGGNDLLRAGGGDDYAFGGAGHDTIRGGAGDDWIYAGTQGDLVRGGDGHDRIYLEEGWDRGYGGAGNDVIFGQDGNDRLWGRAGQDMLSGGRGDDRLFGGPGGDTYRFGYDVDRYGSMPDAGHDVIRDAGEAPAWNDFDRIELFGFYGPSDGTTPEAYARLTFDRAGADMVMVADGGAASLTVRDQFGQGQTQIEELHFNAGYWTPLRFKILDGAVVEIGDDRSYSGNEGGEWNEILFGTDGGDTVFGNSGTNFIWLGAGADTLIYKEADPEIWYGNGGGWCNDIVMDFDPAEDIMDFTEIEGLSLAGLVLDEAEDGDATVYWDSGTWEISDIHIELRGVALAELTQDHFLFA